MIASVPQSGILFVSTFPPVKCGIASFTSDLVNAITAETKRQFPISICSLDKKDDVGFYDSPVKKIMDGHQLDSCIETAGIINNDPSIHLICIEHEFGLYGGHLGEYLLAVMALISKPFIVRFHTVLPAADPKRIKIVQSIALLAEKIIVMTEHSARLLREDYQVAPDKICIIPHGTHTNSTISAEELKSKYNLANKLVLTTFGLLSPNKGIEKGIIAMKEISLKFPEAIYVVLGNTHPNLLKQEGEKYRNFLQQLIDDNDLQNNVRLINEYAPTAKLMEYLALTDIYLFTSKDPYQAVSGTFLYAMSAGCAIISNSFVLANEMLDEKTGVILEPGKDHQLAENAISLLQNEALRKQMGHNAFLKTRETAWKKVAGAQMNLISEILRKPVFPVKLSPQLIG